MLVLARDAASMASAVISGSSREARCLVTEPGGRSRIKGIAAKVNDELCLNYAS